MCEGQKAMGTGEKCPSTSPNCLIEKGNGRIKGFYEPELPDGEG
jgi:hypothetical protein